MEPVVGQFVKYQGSWGLVRLVNDTHVFLDDWRGRILTAAPKDEITEVKSDERRAEDPEQRVYRRYADLKR